MAQSTETKLNKRFDQNIEITGTLTVGGNNVLTTSSVAGGITSTNITNWNTAYGWGNHADAGYLTSLPSHSHQQLSGFANQTEYDVITSGNLNGLRMKARWDGATANRYWDMGFIDGNGNFTSGLKVYNGGNLTYKGNTVIDSGNIGSQSVSYASTSGNADTLDGINSTGFIRDYGDEPISNYNDLAEGIIGTTSTTATNIPYANHNITMTLYNDASSGRKAQLFFGDTPGRLYWRTSQGTSNPPNGWHPWEQVITSNNIGSQSVSYATNAGTLDGIDSSSFLRSDASDTMSGNLTIAATGKLILNRTTGQPNIVGGSDGHVIIDPSNTSHNVYLSHYTAGNVYLANAGGSVYIGASTNSGRLYSDEWGVKVGTDSGYIHFGPANSSWAHIYTDRSAFYFNKNLYVNNHLVWNSDNDGSGSGLDADKLDGLHATDFVKQLSDTTDPNYQTPSSRRVDPNASNPTNEHYAISTFGNGGNVTGQLAVHLSNGSGYLRSHNNSWSGWRKIWTDANDGPGSGLNADLLDGIGGDGYLRSNTADTATGQIKFNGGTRFPDTNGTVQSMWGIYGWDTQLQFTKRNLSTDGYEGTAMFIDYGGLYVQSDYSFRSPIFYDSTNTGRFVDPGATSILGFASFEGANTDYNARTSTGVSIGRYTSEYAYIELGSTHANGGWIDFSSANGQDYNGRIRMYNTDQQMKFFVNGSSSETLNINTGGINISGNAIVSGLVYQAAHQASNLAVGWYTIAVNEGNRAIGRFGIRERAGGRHQTAVFYASHHYGANSGITMLHSGFYSGTPFRYIRVKEGGTYDGALLQVYIEDPSNDLDAFLLGDDFQTGGWTLKDWVPDGTNPGGVGNFAALTNVAAEIDWNDAANGGIIASGNIMAEGTVKSRSSMYSTGKYYDWDNTAYFVEAASQSNLSSLVVGSTVIGDGRMAVRGGDLILDRGKELRWTNTTGSGEYIYSKPSAPYDVIIHSGAYDALQCPNTGEVRINHNGSQKFVTTSSGVSITGTMTASGDVVAYSDERVKENVKTIDNALNKVNSLRGVEYNKIGDNKKGIGVIAQEIEKILPEVVSEDDDGMKAVAYGNIVGVLIEAVKELSNKVEELENKLNGTK